MKKILFVAAVAAVVFAGAPVDAAPPLPPPPGPLKADVVSAGGTGACAVTRAGTISCWGATPSGDVSLQAPTPVVFAAPAEISVGGSHACVIDALGMVWCWGSNSSGQIGQPVPPLPVGMISPVGPPLPVIGLTGVVQVSAGGTHTCALLADTTVSCWGYNLGGQLGDGTTVSRATPAPVPGLTGVVQLSAGDFYTCALLADGTARCWGENFHGQIGDGTTINKRLSPTAVSGLSNAVQIEASTTTTCAVVLGGTVKCWGDEIALGVATTYPANLTPVAVPGLTGVRLLAGGGQHMCAVLSDTSARCWGRNDHGQVGNGTAGAPVGTPQPVLGLSGITTLSGGTAHTCATLANGTAWCWGWDYYGQLGVGAASGDKWVPTRVLGY